MIHVTHNGDHWRPLFKDHIEMRVFRELYMFTEILSYLEDDISGEGLEFISHRLFSVHIP
jgi:hypothetical protein